MSDTKTVIITGASSGFGLLTAKTLADKGHHVFASMRDIGGKNKAAAESLRSFAAFLPEMASICDLVSLVSSNSLKYLPGVNKGKSLPKRILSAPAISTAYLYIDGSYKNGEAAVSK